MTIFEVYPVYCFEHLYVGHLIYCQKYHRYGVCFAAISVFDYETCVSLTRLPQSNSDDGKLYAMALWADSREQAIKNFEEWNEEVTGEGNYVEDCGIVDANF